MRDRYSLVPMNVRSLTLAFVIACSPTVFGSSPNTDLDAVLAKAAKATGAGPGGLDCYGTCVSHGASEKFRFAFDGPSFYDAATGSLTDIAAYDGKGCWEENWANVPHYVVLSEGDSNEMVAWVMSGEWASPDCPLTKKLAAVSADGGISIEIQPRGGQTPAILMLDSGSMLPKSLKYWTESGDETWEFSNYQSFGQRVLPRKTIHRMTETTDSYNIDEAKPARLDSSLFSIPPADLTDTSYDFSMGNEIEVKRMAGYMFVHPLINGKDVGWFFLDTGADVMCIDPKVSAAANFKKLGTDTTAGVVAVVKLPIVRGSSFKLGPVTIANPTFYDFDMSPFQVFKSIQIAGICGYDFLARAILDIDPTSSKIKVYQPAKADLPSAIDWEAATFNGDTPCIDCSFEGDHRGVFSLDTGSSSTVDLFSPIVAKLGLLNGRDTRSAGTGGAGGTAESKTGTLSYFEIGGHRFEKPTVGLQITKQGVFASPYLAGNVGMGFLAQFRLILDYPESRIGFIDQTGKNSR